MSCTRCPRRGRVHPDAPSSSRSLYATDCSTLERLVKPPAARSTKTTASSPLNPPIDETLICCSKRAQDGWDAPYLIDESQVARLTSFEMQPAEWRHGAKLRKWKKGVNCAPRACSASALDGVRVAEKKAAPVAITVHSLALFDANDVQLQRYALGMRLPTETSKPAHALVLTCTDVARTKNGLFQETAVLDEDMFATTTLCDRRARTILDFGTAPQNSIAFSMLDRLVVIPGVGNCWTAWCSASSGTYSIASAMRLLPSGVQPPSTAVVFPIRAIEGPPSCCLLHQCADNERLRVVSRWPVPQHHDALAAPRKDTLFLERVEDALSSRG
ncbi:hypothetical protein EV121DRAFT_296966 [Schizophyllum commune]